MLDFAERFFKLTLDNVYRFSCSALFWIAIAASSERITPIGLLRRVLDWLSIPSSWLAPTESWIMTRAEVVALAGVMMAVVALAFATAADDWWAPGRAGSTALLGSAMLLQTGYGYSVATVSVVALVLIVAVPASAHLVARRLGVSQPGWTEDYWEKARNAAVSLGIAAAYVLSPAGWLVSREQRENRGTMWNPLFIEHVPRPGAPGAAST